MAGDWLSVPSGDRGRCGGVRVLSVAIAFHGNAEQRVQAVLLANRGDAYEARVVQHFNPRDKLGAEGAETLRTIAGVTVDRADLGWRPNWSGDRTRADRVVSQVRYYARLPWLERVARAYKPDVIYSSQQWWDSRAAAYLARRLRLPLVLHLHYVVGPWLGEAAVRRLVTCDHVITVSEFIRQGALANGVAPERATALLNPVFQSGRATAVDRAAVRAELGIGADVPLVGIAARMDPGKGHADTIDAFARIADVHPAARLLILGAGPLRSELEQRAAGTPCADRVTFTGWRTDAPRIMGALDVFVHPSRGDPCPLALLEASAAGLPVVAYRDGGAPELVAHGETGLLAPIDDVDALASHLGRLVGDLDGARRMGEDGRQRMARHHAPETQGRRFAKLLTRVAQR